MKPTIGHPSRVRTREAQDGAFTAKEIAEFNRRHDCTYGWSLATPHIYTRPRFPQSVIGPPGLDKSLEDEELDAIVWEWHTKSACGY
jgi:hypothetical protein